MSLLTTPSENNNTPDPGTNPDPAPKTESWRDTLPDDLKGLKTIETIPDVATLVKNYDHAQRMVGTDKIPLPGKHASDEDWAKVFDKLGRPDSPDKYELKVGEGANEDFVKAFKEMAHKSNILPAQAQQMIDWYQEQTTGAMEAQSAQQKIEYETQLKSLKDEWGVAFEEKRGQAVQAVKEFASEEEIEYLDKKGLTGDPMLARIFAKIGATLKEDQNRQGPQGGQPGVRTPDEARSEINNIMGDMKHPYWNPQHPNHKNAVAEVMRLREMAHPDAQVVARLG